MVRHTPPDPSGGTRDRILNPDALRHAALSSPVVYPLRPVVTRRVDGVPPALLAFLRLALAAVVLLPLAGRRPLPPGEGLRLFGMGAIGFAVAFALTNWGIAESSATNAALLIIVEPVTMLLLGPALLGERLTRGRSRRRRSGGGA